MTTACTGASSETYDMQAVIEGVSSLRLDWQDVMVNYAWLPPWEGLSEPRPNRVKVVFSEHSQVTLEHERALREVRVRPGGSFFIGAESTRVVRVKEWSDTIDMHPATDLLTSEAEARDIDDFRIAATLNRTVAVFEPDPILLGLAHRFRSACLDATTLSDIEASTLACRLVDTILETQTDRRVRRQARRRLTGVALARACEFIETHLARELSLGAIAKQCNLSAFHFAREFKSATGLSPCQYVTQRRLELVKRLLLTSDMPVQEIAWAAGFQNLSHFRRLFRSAIGIRPGNLRATTRAYRPDGA